MASGGSTPARVGQEAPDAVALQSRRSQAWCVVSANAGGPGNARPRPYAGGYAALLTVRPRFATAAAANRVVATSAIAGPDGRSA